MGFLYKYFRSKPFVWAVALLGVLGVASVSATIVIRVNASKEHAEPKGFSGPDRPGPVGHNGLGDPEIDLAHLVYASSHVISSRADIGPRPTGGRGDDSPSPLELLHNSLSFGIPAAVIFIMRMSNSTFVLRKMYPEDWVMIFTFVNTPGFFICLITLINVSGHYATNLYPLQDQNSILFDYIDIENRITGSKIVVSLEQCMLLNTWGVKICIWYFLLRLSRQLPKFIRALRILLIYIVLGFVIIEVCYYFVLCRPFSQYWAMPVDNLQCSTYAHYSIIQMSFNISSDLALVAIPCYMLWISRLSTKQKLLLSVVFSLAIFTIVAAILNKPFTTIYQVWYIREACITQIVGNIIGCYRLLQKIFRSKFSDERNEEVIPRPGGIRAHLANPQMYSLGGSPKTDQWWGRKALRREHIGSFPTQDQTMHGAVNECTGFSEPTFVDSTNPSPIKPALITSAPTTLMTMNLDSDDTLLPIPIAYHNPRSVT